MLNSNRATSAVAVFVFSILVWVPSPSAACEDEVCKLSGVTCVFESENLVSNTEFPAAAQLNAGDGIERNIAFGRALMQMGSVEKKVPYDAQESDAQKHPRKGGKWLQLLELGQVRMESARAALISEPNLAAGTITAMLVFIFTSVLLAMVCCTDFADRKSGAATPAQSMRPQGPLRQGMGQSFPSSAFRSARPSTAHGAGPYSAAPSRGTSLLPAPKGPGFEELPSAPPSHVNLADMRTNPVNRPSIPPPTAGSVAASRAGSTAILPNARDSIRQAAAEIIAATNSAYQSAPPEVPTRPWCQDGQFCPDLVVPGDAESLLAVQIGQTSGTVDIYDPTTGSQFLQAEVKKGLSGRSAQSLSQEPAVSLKMLVARTRSEMLRNPGRKDKFDRSTTANCFLRRGLNGDLAMEMCNAKGELFGVLKRDPSRPASFMLQAGQAGTTEMIFQGIFEDHAVMVTSAHQEPLADAEPCSMPFDPSSRFCKLRVSGGCDAGLVLCSLISIDVLNSLRY
eukprot:TRINITY_DN79568_c0_g1_i1.p1 TRINITY_DN79568_c0_g1~~TRINITY_DN79568_c0_g1_i1.p1  ORF type:complete len:510 (-),score=84.46 TRINITY_DN79568_c0_g1_i1:110-1639(-)